MNALTRNFPRVVPVENDASVPFDVSLYGAVAAIALSLVLHAGLVISDNLFGNGDYCIFCSDGSGSAGIAAHATDATYENNVHVEQPSGDWSATHPGGTNKYAADRTDVGFEDESTEDYRLSAASDFAGTASDGGDPGAHVAAVTSRVSGVTIGEPA